MPKTPMRSMTSLAKDMGLGYALYLRACSGRSQPGLRASCALVQEMCARHVRSCLHFERINGGEKGVHGAGGVTRCTLSPCVCV